MRDTAGLYRFPNVRRANPMRPSGLRRKPLERMFKAPCKWQNRRELCSLSSSAGNLARSVAAARRDLAYDPVLTVFRVLTNGIDEELEQAGAGANARESSAPLSWVQWAWVLPLRVLVVWTLPGAACVRAVGTMFSVVAAWQSSSLCDRRLAALH